MDINEIQSGQQPKPMRKILILIAILILLGGAAWIYENQKTKNSETSVNSELNSQQKAAEQQKLM